MNAREPDFQRLGELMEGDEGLGLGRGVRETGGEAHGEARRATPARRIAELWPDVVGAEIADNTEPLRLVKGRLIVACSSSTWAQTLQLMAGQMRERLNQALGAEAVEEMVFRHAGWTRSMSGAEGPRASSQQGVATSGATAAAHADHDLSDEQQQALADVQRLDLPPTIKERLLVAMRRSFARGEQENGR